MSGKSSTRKYREKLAGEGDGSSQGWGELMAEQWVTAKSFETCSKMFLF